MMKLKIKKVVYIRIRKKKVKKNIGIEKKERFSNNKK